MALGDDKFSKPEGKFYRDKNGNSKGFSFLEALIFHQLTQKMSASEKE